MIEISHVSFKYANAKEPALHDISLSIQKGEFVVLLGTSGCGKTTITRLINRLVPEFFEGEMEGNITIDGQNTDELRIQDLAGIVGSVFQDPRSQFFATDTTAEIAFSCENVGLPREELCYRIERAANDLQITRLLERSIFELSSGEKQSIAIASVYALSPKILVLDEPSANLDSAATQHLMKILDSLKKQGYTIVISEHRVHYLKDIADRAILIENGKIKKEIRGEDFRNLSNKEANAMGLRSINLLSVSPRSVDYHTGENQIELKNISYYYSKSDKPLRNITFSADKGAVIGIIGNNGVGKSTLLEIICGLKKEMLGNFLINGKPVNPKIRNRDAFLVMQNSDYQLFTESVEKELYLGNTENELLRKKGISLLKRMGLSDYLQQHPASLSGGQKQRLCIAVACMKNTGVICFDEPTSGLDYISMKNVSSLLHELSQEGKTLLVTSHDYEFLMSTCTHICYLNAGKVEDYFAVSQKTAPKIYQILFQKEEKR